MKSKFLTAAFSAAKTPRKIGMAAFMAVSTMIAPLAANAAVVEIAFTGEVASVTDGIANTFAAGDTLSGVVRFDNSIPPVFAIGVTEGQITATNTSALSISYAINGLDFDISSGRVSVQNDARNGGVTPLSDAIGFNANGTATGPVVEGLNPSTIAFRLSTQVLATLSDAGLPTAAEINAMFAINESTSSTNFFTFGGSEFARYNITSAVATMAPVPLPATGLMLIAGLAGFGAMRKRRKTTS